MDLLGGWAVTERACIIMGWARIHPNSAVCVVLRGRRGFVCARIHWTWWDCVAFTKPLWMMTALNSTGEGGGGRCYNDDPQMKTGVCLGISISTNWPSWWGGCLGRRRIEDNSRHQMSRSSSRYYDIRWPSNMQVGALRWTCTLIFSLEVEDGHTVRNTSKQFWDQGGSFKSRLTWRVSPLYRQDY